MCSVLKSCLPRVPFTRKKQNKSLTVCGDLSEKFPKLHSESVSEAKIQPNHKSYFSFLAVADPPSGGRQHTILQNVSKNCMKLKEFGPPGGVP